MSSALVLAQLAMLDLPAVMRGEVLAIVAKGFAELEITHKAAINAAELGRTRSLAAARQRRHRAKVVGDDTDIFDMAGTDATAEALSIEPERDIERDASVTERDADKERTPPTPPKERNTTPRDAPARESIPAKSCSISLEAFDLADAIGAEAGYAAPADWPPGWCGAAGDIQRFLNEGYTAQVIRMACTAVMRRGRGPPEYFAYFVKPIIDMRTRLEAPLPQVKPRQWEVIDGGRNRTQNAPMGHKSGSLQAACEQLRAELRRRSEPAGACPEPSGDAIRLLPANGC